MQARDYPAMIKDLRHADAGDPIELATRFFLLFIGFSYFAYWQSDLNFLYWLIAYSALHFFYVHALLQSKDNATRTSYRRFLMVAFIAVLMFEAVVLYLWQTGDPLCRFGAVSALIGQGIFTLARHRKLRDLAIIESIMISATALGIAAMLGIEFESLPILAGCMLVTILVSAHFVLNVHDNYREEQRILAAEIVRAREERLKTIGQLTAGVAHDFNNSLTAVLGHLELFAQTDNTEEQRDYVSAARSAADRAVVLTQQLMAYARQAPLDRDYREALPLLMDVIRDHRSVFDSQTDGRLIVDLPQSLEDLSPFWVDGERLQHAVSNLLRNGMAAIPQHGEVRLSASIDTLRKSVTLSNGAVLKEGQYIAITVSDNGSGIAPENIEHVIEPFWSTRGHANGSGLGLAMVHGFAEQSGGGLDIQSWPDQGTVVTLRLPYTTDES